ncbi:MAG TPA: XdhC/CoxI family protein [Elusimicrobiota bacterium]|nr:XdhC/CoxI family protein [Elusimicrobiota bacterium]
MKENNDVFRILSESIRNGRDVALATIISAEGSTPRETGAKMLVFEDGSIQGTVGGGKLEALCIKNALSAMESGQNRKVTFELTEKGIGMACAGKTEVFIEVYLSRLKLFICGAGHVGQKIAAAATVAGIPYSVADEREEFACRDHFPQASRIHVEQPDHALTAARVDDKTYVVIVTRGHMLDKECLAAAMETKAAYIGMIGSRSKVPTIFKLLNKKGIHPEKDPRVYSPIGLDTGGKTPGEISVSVIAEILKLRHQATGNHLSLRK